MTTTRRGTPPSGPGQTVAYDANGKPTVLTAGTTTQTNVYDGAGGSLLRVDSSTGAALYLARTELNTAPGSATVTGVRTYSANGTPIAERTSTAGVWARSCGWLSADLVNTALMQIDASTGAIFRRCLDPYGNPRGAAASWSSNHGYLNAPTRRPRTRPISVPVNMTP